MSLLVFSICWSPKNVGSSGSEGMDVLARLEQSFLLLFLISVEGLAQIKGVPSRLKVRTKGPCLPTQRSGFPHFKPSMRSLTGVPSISDSSWQPRIAIALPSVSSVACSWSWSQKQCSDLNWWQRGDLEKGVWWLGRDVTAPFGLQQPALPSTGGKMVYSSEHYKYFIGLSLKSLCYCFLSFILKTFCNNP